MGVMKMSDKERLRKAILEMVKQKKLTLIQASHQCEVSYRQILRLYKDYITDGDAGLTHKGRGRPSNRKNPHQEAIISLYTTKYEGFGPTLASEYLEREGFTINHDTLRKLLISKGLWKKQRKRSPYRQRREPMEQFGELVQIDGSIHDWLGINKHDCLLNMVDDATSKTQAILDYGETTRVVFLSIWRWIERYGIPLAFYVDLKNVYVAPKDTNFSHVQVACNKLGIRIVKARSPQAKGRVERSHAVYQDRFVKELHLQQIKTIKEANAILDGGFIDNLNNKFEKSARNPESAHRPLGDINLNQILCWEYDRQVQHDWSFSFSGQHYQVEKSHGLKVGPKSKIKVRKHLDGKMSAWHNDKALLINPIAKRVTTTEKTSPIKSQQDVIAKKVVNSSNWHESNSFLFRPDNETKQHHTTLRKREI